MPDIGLELKWIVVYGKPLFRLATFNFILLLYASTSSVFYNLIDLAWLVYPTTSLLSDHIF